MPVLMASSVVPQTPLELFSFCVCPCWGCIVLYEFRSVEAFSTVPVTPVVVPSAGHRGPYAAFFKRMLDMMLLAVLALPVLVTLCTLAALIARDGGSPFYV